MRIRWRESPGSLASNSTSVGTQRTPWTIVPSATSCNWRFVTFSATVATYLQNQLSFPIYILARRCACSNLPYNWKPSATGKKTDTKTYSFVSPEDGCDTLCAKSPAHNKLPSLHSSTFYHVKPQCPTFKIINMHILLPRKYIITAEGRSPTYVRCKAPYLIKIKLPYTTYTLQPVLNIFKRNCWDNWILLNWMVRN